MTENHTELNKTEARQAETNGIGRYILIFSLVGAVIAVVAGLIVAT